MLSSCLEISSFRIDEPLTIASARADNFLVLKTNRIDEPLTIASARADNFLVLRAHRIDEPLVTESQIVCGVASGYYLKIEPDVIWLNPENNFNVDVLVKSNTDWIIE